MSSTARRATRSRGSSSPRSPKRVWRNAPLRFRCGHGSQNYVPGVRLREGRGDAVERLPALLRLRGLPDASETPLRRLLRFLLVCGSCLSAEADRHSLSLAEALTLGVKAGVLLGRDRRMKASRDIPAKGVAQGAPLADALGRTATTLARRIVKACDQAHGRSLSRRRNSPRPTVRRTSTTRPRARPSATGGDFPRRRQTA